jgi:lysophospholipase L1-like esterase
LVLALTSLMVVVTCGASTRLEGGPNAGPVAPDAASPMPATAQPAEVMPKPLVAPAGAALAPAAPAPAPAPAPDTLPITLARFFGSLQQLQQGTRSDHVRVVWLGDSHTAADLWTHVVRQALQGRFGVGGPGFFQLGLKQTRHSQVQTDVLGSWQRVPGQPSRTQPFADGVFGLSGMRAVAKDGAGFKARLRQGAVVGKARWSLRYRAPERSAFQLKLGAHAEVIRGSRGSATEIQHFDRELEPEAELVLRQLGGMPEFYGATVESSEPGVVLDTLGIDGARARTPLAWQADSWERELASRRADLIVLAYGTNEVFESQATTEYARHYRELLGRIRRVAPSADCWIIGPTDVMQTEGRSHPRVVEISLAQAQVASELGCAYVGAHELMGGEGSYAEWQTSQPRLAGLDGVHLTVRGYQELGKLTTEYLMHGYDHFAPPTH